MVILIIFYLKPIAILAKAVFAIKSFSYTAHFLKS